MGIAQKNDRWRFVRPDRCPPYRAQRRPRARHGGEFFAKQPAPSRIFQDALERFRQSLPQKFSLLRGVFPTRIFNAVNGLTGHTKALGGPNFSSKIRNVLPTRVVFAVLLFRCRNNRSIADIRMSKRERLRFDGHSQSPVYLISAVIFQV